jgi:adenylyltransferase/sulfurtransferase
MQELSAATLRQWIGEGRIFSLVDVREPYEHEHFNIGGSLIPLGELMSRKNEISKEAPVVVYCEKGIRSVIAIQRLEESGFQNLYNLAGGMRAWRIGNRDNLGPQI